MVKNIAHSGCTVNRIFGAISGAVARKSRRLGGRRTVGTEIRDTASSAANLQVPVGKVTPDSADSSAVPPRLALPGFGLRDGVALAGPTRVDVRICTLG